MVQAILGAFWVDEDTPDEVRAMELQGWLKVLDAYTADDVSDAWAEYQRSGPRSEAGRLARPDAGALYRIIVKARANAAIATRRPAPPEQQLPPPPRVTAAQALKIIKDVGFRVKRFPEVGEGSDV